MSIMNTIESYKNVITDLNSIGFDADVIALLENRVQEIKKVYSLELELELIEIEASKSRHPAGRRKTQIDPE